MSLEELKVICDQQEAYGLNRIMLTKPEPKGGIRGYKVRTPFGNAEVANVNDGKVLFWIEISKVRKYIKKASQHVAKE